MSTSPPCWAMNRPPLARGPLAEGRDLLAVGDEEERDAILLVEL